MCQYVGVISNMVHPYETIYGLYLFGLTTCLPTTIPLYMPRQLELGVRFHF